MAGDKIAELQAALTLDFGNTLDRIIATEVMGWVFVERYQDGGECWRTPEGSVRTYVPRYSISLDDAFEVHDVLHKRGWLLFLDYEPEGVTRDARWTVGFGHTDFDAYDSSCRLRLQLPREICRLALRIVIDERLCS